MIATFDNTVGILVKAYLEDTLLKGDCCACAVGNICAAAAGYQVVDIERGDSIDGINARWSESTAVWQRVFSTVAGVQQTTPQAINIPLVRRQISATGYTWQQLAKIEKAFETAAEGFTEEAEFAGLMAVIDVLAKIHGVKLTAAKAAKSLFVKA